MGERSKDVVLRENNGSFVILSKGTHRGIKNNERRTPKERMEWQRLRDMEKETRNEELTNNFKLF